MRTRNQERHVNRLEAAVKAWDHHWGDRYGDEALEEMGEEVQVALDAADAVMFSDEAIERTAHAIWNATGHDPSAWVYMAPETHRKQRYMSYAKAAIAALKGDA